jgi:GNAT superfamily N-acetyltransferase
MGLMPQLPDEIEHALEVFVRGFCVGKSATHPYEYLRVGKLWVMRDGPRKNPKNYRKEEWVAYGVAPREVDAAARRQTRGRFFVCAVRGMDESEERLRASYKELGYRLLATEPLFVHRLKRIPRAAAAVTIEQVKSPEMAARFGKATRTRPIAVDCLTQGAPFRQYAALEDGDLVGWVRSVNAGDSTWCSNMVVRPSHRRRGIGSALLARMLRDDRARGFKQSVLLSSHTGALVYPRVGYEQIGLLLIFAPKKQNQP